MATNTLRIQLLRGTAAELAASNPVLQEGEPGYAIDTGVLRIGDGTSNWLDLPTIVADLNLQTAIEAANAATAAATAATTAANDATTSANNAVAAVAAQAAEVAANTTGRTSVRPISTGGTGANTASSARTALGLEISTDVQAFDQKLESLSALNPANNQIAYFTSETGLSLTNFTAAARSLLDDADAAAQRVTLGVEASTNPDWSVDTTKRATRGDTKAFVDAAISARLLPDFESSEYSLTPGQKYFVPHGLGAIPTHVSVRLRCKVAINGYSVGQEVDAPGFNDVGSGVGIGVARDDTNVSVIIGASGVAISSATGGSFGANAANFDVVVYAWL
ncbi:hypothetical protein [uncultured Roseobacter sp.]|uniref:hyaluronate lyase N-terminal domain-containing protein n=1 Tax=uncultured Roseobacter sp. TaxID=114847 RepID=UPI002626564A|nr:hypothetical protein [uncultured Roseobacter sp.]